MPDIQIPIIKGDKINSRADYADFLPKNMLAVAKEIRGAAGYLISHAGLSRIMTATGANRGSFFNDRIGKAFMVSGNSLVSIDSVSAYTNIGAIDGAGQCSMPYSFQSQLVVSGGNVYRYASGVLTRLTDADFGRPIDADWIDGYYFFTDGEYLYHTLVNDETQVDPLDYAVAEIMPDKSLGVMRTADNLMMVFGRYSIEYFVNDASTAFAFSRIEQKSMKIGICGTYCKTELSGGVFILGSRRFESPAIYALSAGDAQQMSTRTINQIIGQYTESELSTAVLESRFDGDDELLIVRLARHTLVFNLTAAKKIGADNAWSVLSTGVSGAPWIACNGVFVPYLNKWLYGSAADGAIFALDYESAAQDGDYCEMEFETPLIEAPFARIGKIELNTVTGFQAEQTNCFISTSIDGELESSEYVQLYGNKGDYATRFVAWGFGYYNKQLSLRVRTLSKDKVNFSKLTVTYG